MKQVDCDWYISIIRTEIISKLAKGNVNNLGRITVTISNMSERVFKQLFMKHNNKTFGNEKLILRKTSNGGNTRITSRFDGGHVPVVFLVQKFNKGYTFETQGTDSTKKDVKYVWLTWTLPFGHLTMECTTWFIHAHSNGWNSLN